MRHGSTGTFMDQYDGRMPAAGSGTYNLDVIIYRNAACGTSRNVLGLIRNAGIEAVWTDYDNGVASGRAPRSTPHTPYSKPFAFRTVWAGGEERNVTSALAASA